MKVGSIVVGSAGHIQEFAARVFVLNEVTTVGIEHTEYLIQSGATIDSDDTRRTQEGC